MNVLASRGLGLVFVLSYVACGQSQDLGDSGQSEQNVTSPDPGAPGASSGTNDGQRAQGPDAAASGSGSDADAGNGGSAAVDPFDPASCTGRLTSSDLYKKLPPGQNHMTVGSYVLVSRARHCVPTPDQPLVGSCSEWTIDEPSAPKSTNPWVTYANGGGPNGARGHVAVAGGSVYLQATATPKWGLAFGVNLETDPAAQVNYLSCQAFDGQAPECNLLSMQVEPGSPFAGDAAAHFRGVTIGPSCVRVDVLGSNRPAITDKFNPPWDERQAVILGTW